MEFPLTCVHLMEKNCFMVGSVSCSYTERLRGGWARNPFFQSCSFANRVEMGSWSGSFCFLSAKPALITSTSFSPHLCAGFLLAYTDADGHTHVLMVSIPGTSPAFLGPRGVCLQSCIKLQGQSLAIPALSCVSSRCLDLSSVAWFSPKIPSPLICVIVVLFRSLKRSVGNKGLWVRRDLFSSIRKILQHFPFLA